MAAITVKPVAGALGAEIEGVDIGMGLDVETVALVRQALLDHLVIFFHDQEISSDSFMAFARAFGEPAQYPLLPGIEGYPLITEIAKLEHERNNFGGIWHADTTYLERPPMGSMLYALEVPDLCGLTLGDTEFASAAAAWDALPEPLRRKLDGRRAVFDFTGRKRAFPPTQDEIDRNPPVRHPIVRTHPHTGRKCLYVMRDDCTGIEGVAAEEAEALIAALADHIVKPEFVYRHQWRPGDLLMWDNCTVQHRAIQDYDLPQRRLMHRTTMGGEVPA